jgi:lipopolysaccharide/colanic/teichoic acid biosynthesis glycosyltransferase
METEATIGSLISMRRRTSIRPLVSVRSIKEEAPDCLSDDLVSLIVERYAGLESAACWYRARVGLKSFLRTLTRRWANTGKRLIDLVAGALLIFVLTPVFLLIAALIKLDSRGPVLFRQTRVGQFGKTFELYKFRSMHPEAESQKAELLKENQIPGGIIFKMRNDPRVTRLGRILRRYSIDELPQLINVLKGEMSMVGPRPAVPLEVGQYTLSARRRLDVKPGITCIWQVSGRSDLPFAKQVELDVDYIDAQSAWLDLKLIARTVPTVLQGRGAY